MNELLHLIYYAIVLLIGIGVGIGIGVTARVFIELAASYSKKIEVLVEQKVHNQKKNDTH